MPRVTTVLRQARKAVEDLDLLKALQSEINHELSSSRVQSDESGSSGAFVLDWDSPKSQDVILRKKCESGEEVAVSALLGRVVAVGDGRLPREALIKVCIKKPGLNSFLQFDCGLWSMGGSNSEFYIRNAYYIPSSSCLGSSVYKGPLFSSLDPELQDELKQYLVTKGIKESFTNFLLLHLHKKEQSQYVNWLHRMKTILEKDE